MKKWFVIGGIGIACFGIAFVAAHAFVAEEKRFSAFTPVDLKSPWKRVAPLTSEPVKFFDGTSVMSDPWVIREARGYKMWFTLVKGVGGPKQTLGIAVATSPDGLSWTVSDRHVMAPDPAGWDAEGVETACVVPHHKGGWAMYYTGDHPPAGGHHMSIGLATSKDGKTWQRHSGGPVVKGEYQWEQPFETEPGGPKIGGVLEPTVLYDSNEKRYRMWYAGLGIVAGIPRYSIGYAESENGILWRKRAKPVFEPSSNGWDDALVSHCNVAKGPDGRFHLFYFGSSKSQYGECDELGGCAMTPGAIGHAVSDDGITWRRSSNLPILSPRLGEWDSWAIGGPSAMVVDGKWRLWYFGNGTHTTYTARFGLCTLTR